MKQVLQKYKKRIRLLIVCVILLILAGGLALVYGHLAGMLESQKAAERYRGESDKRFAQVTAFFPVGEGIDRQKVFEFEKSLDSKLLEASVEATKNGSLYIDAFSAYGQITVTGNKGSADVRVLGVGGDYFQFHPLYLKSGNYITGDDLMKDSVVLDEELAWRLFGGIDVAGMTVTIGGAPYRIAGVVSREDDFATEKTYSDGAGMFMAYDTLNGISETQISCYELVCADPVSGFVLDAVASGFSAADTVENSSRFDVSTIFGLIKSFGTRSGSTKAIAYPYWENAARMVEDILTLLLVVILLLLILPAIVAIVACVLGCKFGVGKLRNWVPQIIEKRRERAYERRREAHSGR